MTQDEETRDTNGEAINPEPSVRLIGRLPTKEDFEMARRSTCFVTMGPEERERLNKLLSD